MFNNQQRRTHSTILSLVSIINIFFTIFLNINNKIINQTLICSICPFSKMERLTKKIQQSTILSQSPGTHLTFKNLSFFICEVGRMIFAITCLIILFSTVCQDGRMSRRTAELSHNYSNKEEKKSIRPSDDQKIERGTTVSAFYQCGSI